MAASDQLSLKLLIDRNSQQVLFAEADKDFVDFLFNLLCLPAGSIVRHLSESKHKMAGCLGNLYESVEKLSDAYFQRNSSKDDLLDPKGISLKYFVCSSCHRYVTDIPATANCPRCKCRMSQEVQYVGPSDEGGFVKGVVTYTVTDDLMVMPMSSISSIALLSKFNIKDVRSLEEEIVDLGMEEGLELLRASLQSKAVLTEVFLGKTGKITREVSSPKRSGDEVCKTRKITWFFDE